MQFRRTYFLTLILILLITASFGAGYWLRTVQDKSLAQFPILDEAYGILLAHGLKDPPQSPALEYGMIRGLLQAYDDPYTIFVEPVQHELESDALHGSFGGIGVRLGTDPQGFVVLFPFPDSPAKEAGIQDGDRLLAIEGKPVELNTPVDQIQSAIRGPAGQKVKLTIGRAPDYQPIQVEIKRAEIPLPSVTWHPDLVEPVVGIIQINLIASSTSDEIQKAVKDLQARGASYFVLDLRDNPGGLLTAGVDVARLFLKDGVVIQEQYKGRAVETYKVDKPGPLANLPLVVLINNGSASAAEIIAGSLKIHQRALLVGSPTFGKDTIQLVFDLNDKSSLHVTAAHWWVPGLEPPLGGVGLQPDILIRPEEDNSGEAALRAAVQSVLTLK